MAAAYNLTGKTVEEVYGAPFGEFLCNPLSGSPSVFCIRLYLDLSIEVDV